MKIAEGELVRVRPDCGLSGKLGIVLSGEPEAVGDIDYYEVLIDGAAMSLSDFWIEVVSQTQRQGIFTP